MKKHLPQFFVEKNPYDSGKVSEWVAMDPVFGTSGSKVVIKKTIDEVAKNIDIQNFPNSVILGCDQGEYGKVLAIRAENPEKYNWVQPVLGVSHIWVYVLSQIKQKHGFWIYDLFLALDFKNKKSVEAMMQKNIIWKSQHELTIVFMIVQDLLSFLYIESLGFPDEWVDILSCQKQPSARLLQKIDALKTDSSPFRDWLNNKTFKDKTLNFMKQFVAVDFPSALGLHVGGRTSDSLLTVTSIRLAVINLMGVLISILIISEA
jgi:hypothetical protein